MLILNIACQHLEDECELEGWVGEIHIYIYLYWIYDANNLGSICHLKIYVDIGYIMPTFGGLMKVGGFLSALWHRVGECTYLEIYICIGYMMPTIWGIYVT